MAISRRDVIVGTSAAITAGLPSVTTAQAARLMQRKIPSSGEALPVIGVGTARRYSSPTEAALAPLRATLARFHELGGAVIDTAPSYGEAEPVVGALVAGLGVRPDLFLATKVGANDKAAGLAQIEQSFKKLRTDRIDLIAVHNIRDVTVQLATLRAVRDAGRIQYLGITTSSSRQYADFEAVMRRESMDMIQVDYALDNRGAADRILPLAQDRGMGVMINLPFGRQRLFSATRDKPLPEWAGEIGAVTWAQVFLKYLIAHPAVTCVIPGMAQVSYVDDNLGAARGPLPDAALRRRTEQFIDAL